MRSAHQNVKHVHIVVGYYSVRCTRSARIFSTYVLLLFERHTNFSEYFPFKLINHIYIQGSPPRWLQWRGLGQAKAKIQKFHLGFPGGRRDQTLGQYSTCLAITNELDQKWSKWYKNQCPSGCQHCRGRFYMVNHNANPICHPFFFNHPEGST